MSPQKWLDAAHELGKIRDELLSLADTWEEPALSEWLKATAMQINNVTVTCYANGLRIKE